MKGMGGSTYKEERRTPKVGGGGSQQMAGLSALMGMMIGQQKGQQAKQQTQGNPFEQFGIPEAERQDYNLNRKFSNVSGTLVPTNIPELKPMPLQGQQETINLGRSVNAQLEKNTNQMIGSQNIQRRANPANLTAHSNFVGNLGLQIEGLFNSKGAGEFAEFKGQTQQLFQTYRKYITGVQAGFQELGMLEPIFPQPTDPPNIYISKALGAIKTMQTNEGILLKYLQGQGYRTSGWSGEPPFDPENLRRKAQIGGINVGPEVPGTGDSLGQGDQTGQNDDPLGLFS